MLLIISMNNIEISKSSKIFAAGGTGGDHHFPPLGVGGGIGVPRENSSADSDGFRTDLI